MKLYGYEPADIIEDVRPMALAEVTLNATPHELRRMSALLAACADEMERMGTCQRQFAASCRDEK